VTRRTDQGDPGDQGAGDEGDQGAGDPGDQCDPGDEGDQGDPGAGHPVDICWKIVSNVQRCFV